MINVHYDHILKLLTWVCLFEKWFYLPHEFVDLSDRHCSCSTIFQGKSDETRVGISRLREAVVFDMMCQLRLLFGKLIGSCRVLVTSKCPWRRRDLLHGGRHGRHDLQAFNAGWGEGWRGGTVPSFQLSLLHDDWRRTDDVLLAAVLVPELCVDW